MGINMNRFNVIRFNPGVYDGIYNSVCVNAVRYAYQKCILLLYTIRMVTNKHTKFGL